ncbi:type I addiction module toxin, SymE family [Thalassomonas viridans]|uniref:Type I addiction module toxin, SymE family n=1 Tax=Thalassomonas viridans TaxID=137584 RepID=A0AAE9Z4M0_9GAMM|nr:SymE family type I addiction module toxin [Thalassomonas viridans]WDE05168.1 type I addiction module toxin, SymE family [Thalassomonas viridans]
MADSNHTPEPRPAKAKYPAPRQLTVLETIRGTAKRTREVGLHYVPVVLEPCVVLRGKWLNQAGFTAGQKVTVTAGQEGLMITPSLTSKALANL